MKNYKAIHQFTPSVAFGDSVSNGLIFTQKLLHSMGFESNIYICDMSVDRMFCHEVYNIQQYEESKEHILLYHHSIGHKCHDKIMSFLDQKVLVYHNITPSHFFTNEKHLQVACDEGRTQLKNAASDFIGSYADSLYNCNELRYYNYKNPITLPLLVDLDKKIAVLPNEQVVEKYHDTYNILFVGRIVQNKCQHQLLDVLFQLEQKKCHNIKLFIVGGVSQPTYFNYLFEYAKNLGLNTKVIITNKVSDEDLAAYYKAADLYLSLSEHEGFGMPFIEAMKYDIPILAYNAGGISSTVVQESLLENKAADFIADEIIKLQNNSAKRVSLVKKQKKHLQNFSFENTKNKFIEYLNSLNIKTPEKIKIKSVTKEQYQVEGPFDSTYSLAIVNKNIALALDDEADVKLYSTEGNGNFLPDLKNLDSKTKKLMEKTSENIDVTIRNLYPPRANAMLGYHKIIGPYGWEESKFPTTYSNWFNTKLTMIFTMSHYVKNVLQNSGVNLPIVTTGIVVEDILNIVSEPFLFTLPDGFRLLHISSCFPRKGVDVLLKSFELLDSSKEISLVIKTFTNPHNTLLKQLEESSYSIKKEYEEDVFLYEKGKKKILVINKDIAQSQIKYLYENTDVLVVPSFGEGFGLPHAEAMLLNLPVITTAFGGQSDFCTEETSWLIDFDFDFAKTHLSLKNSLWQVPKIISLKKIIEEFPNKEKSEIEAKIQKAKKYILDNYSSKKVAQNIQDAIQKESTEQKVEKIALFSTYNTRCGIALYSKYLISSFENKVTIFANKTKEKLIDKENKNTIRCWETRDSSSNIETLEEQLLSQNITTFIIQYNFSFLSLPLLEKLLLFCNKHDIKTYLFLHSTKDVVAETYMDTFKDIYKSLQKVTQIYIHTLEDINYLKAFGIYKNTSIFTHGINTTYLSPKTINKTISDIPTLATFGFLLPQKGIFELIDIVEELHNKGKKVNLLLLNSIHPAPISQNLESKLREKIQNSKISSYITLNTNYLEEKEIVRLLSSVDKLVFLYKNTQESSSAAVRIGLLSQKEVITTPIPIFSDVKEVLTQSKNESKEAILETIESSLLKKYDNTKQLQWIEENSWSRISQDFYDTVTYNK